MNIDNINQPKASNDDCNEESILLLIDFADGNLSTDEASKVQSHIDSSIKYKSIYQSMIKSKNLLKKVETGRIDYVDSINATKRIEQITKIKELINKENQIKSNEVSKISGVAASIPLNVSVSGFTRQKIRIFSIFKSRNWAYASTAAGVAVLVLVSYIFMSGNFKMNNNYKSSFNSDMLTEQPADMAGSRANEIAENQATTGRNTTDAAVKEATKDSQNYDDTQYAPSYSSSCATSNPSKPVTKSSTAGSQASGNQSKASSQCNQSIASQYGVMPNYGVKEGDANYISIASSYSQELWAIMLGSTTYLEICNNIDYYRAIVVFPSTIIQAKEINLIEIKNKLLLLNLTTKIEFISGEDEQKLVEYTSKENATLLRTNAVANSADFLVISICR